MQKIIKPVRFYGKPEIKIENETRKEFAKASLDLKFIKIDVSLFKRK